MAAIGQAQQHARAGDTKHNLAKQHPRWTKGGALGAVIAEATAELYNAGSSGAKPFTKELGQITAIVAAAAAGQDVAVAQLAGGNAVENNFLTHTEAAQMRKEFDACNKKSGGCTDEERRALVNCSIPDDCIAL